MCYIRGKQKSEYFDPGPSEPSEEYNTPSPSPRRPSPPRSQPSSHSTMHTQRSHICHSKNFDAKDGNDCYNTNREAGCEGVAGMRIKHRSDSKTMHEELSSTGVRQAGGFKTDELLQSGRTALTSRYNYSLENHRGPATTLMCYFHPSSRGSHPRSWPSKQHFLCGLRNSRKRGAVPQP